MIIIAGHYRVGDKRERDRVVGLFRDLVERARRADGCIEAVIAADSVDPRRVDMLEVWRDAEALERWRAVADAPDPGVEIDATYVKRYEAEDGGPLF